MKKADYTRKTQALQSERQTLERYTTELRSKVQEIEQDLAAQRQQAQETLKDGAAKRDHYAEQLKRIADAQREHVTQWDRVDWDRLQRESPERIGPLLLQRDQAREALAEGRAGAAALGGGEQGRGRTAAAAGAGSLCAVVGRREAGAALTMSSGTLSGVHGPSEERY